jgi:hypothetical protein
MLKAFALSTLRHGLTAAGGALVAKGALDPGSAEAIIGGLMAVGGLVLSWLEKRKYLPA